ncbi:hypothetical protein EVAR_30706_1 [Eumeta japonica]|uniref:Amino acid transporter transmembrane domain-containing protein n=1 Tax=Eumeta variegata TaxID=151549 RepID=A0A4C1V8U0_EUMVA|nr:hypothetical protein EVAR_30706_1 [Eumeta japonica]
MKDTQLTNAIDRTLYLTRIRLNIYCLVLAPTADLQCVWEGVKTINCLATEAVSDSDSSENELLKLSDDDDNEEPDEGDEEFDIPNPENLNIGGIPASVPLFIVALLVTLAVFISASRSPGRFEQHVKRVYVHINTLKERAPGSFGATNPPGWSKEATIMMFMNHFIKFVIPTKDHPAIALMVTINATFPISTINLAKENDFTLRRCIVRSTIVAFAVFLGEAVPRFDLVMGLIGSTLTGPLMFIFPPLLFLKLCYMKRDTFPMYQTTKEENANTRSPINRRPIGIQNVGNTILPPSKYRTTYRTFPSFNNNDSSDDVKWYDIMIAFVAMSVGITATVVATYSSWSEVVNYAAFSTPCIVNASAAARDFLQVTTKE